ncbi:MAG: hypothetical protein ACK5LR_01800 [Mangrovibacterium sp.]
MKVKYSVLLLFCFVLSLSSCESEAEKRERLAREKQEQIAREQREKENCIAKETRLEKERQERIIYERYINNSLRTGATPYTRYYGGNPSCNNYGCSEIRVTTSNSDVLVTIKKDGKVVRHAYINSGSSYSFSFPNGTYQTFFYYGKGWNPEKEMKGGKIKGGFVTDESYGKDTPQYLENAILEYELILQRNGNFSTRPSNPEEAL